MLHTHFLPGPLRALAPAPRNSPPPLRALGWVRAQVNPDGGIYAHSGHANSYPEATGYFTPTLLDYGERRLAADFVQWLVCIQRPDGCFTDPDAGAPYIFDTGQVLRGLLAGRDLAPGVSSAARRAAGYLCARMINGGAGGYPNAYQGRIPETVHLYVLPPLMAAAKMFQDTRMQSCAERCLEHYTHHKDFLQLQSLTHYLAFEIEALIDLGQPDRVGAILETLETTQAADGAIPARTGASWVCSPGMAQLAVCWYKAGRWAPADRALEWLERRQTPSGGFLGSYGRNADYLPEHELSWTQKFYLDAARLRVRSRVERAAPPAPAAPGEVDRVAALIRPGHRLVEVGCGTGVFLDALRRRCPNVQCTGAEISPALLDRLPAEIQRLLGWRDAVACPDSSFDVVFSRSVLEQCVNPATAVRELARIARPGGWLVLLEEGSDRVEELLKTVCDDVEAEPLGAGQSGMLWKGRKRFALSGAQWNDVYVSRHDPAALIQRVRLNHLSPWGRHILLATGPGDRVVEIGSGTGEMSLALAQAGRQVTAVDISDENLAYIQDCAKELGVSLCTVHADATQPLPFADGEFDCAWSSGLLDRFPAEVRRRAIREFARVSRDRVVTMLANAACLAYRIGKDLQETRGTWPFGWELPIHSLTEDFRAAGLTVVEEFSAGVKEGLAFLPSRHPLRKLLTDWSAGKTELELRDYNQGYLLVTRGVKCLE